MHVELSEQDLTSVLDQVADKLLKRLASNTTHNEAYQVFVDAGRRAVAIHADFATSDGIEKELTRIVKPIVEKSLDSILRRVVEEVLESKGGVEKVAFKSLLLNIRGKIDDMIYKDEE